MDLLTFKSQSTYFPISGYDLTPEEKACALLSLQILKKENKFSSVFFIGKVFGIKNDYLLAVGFPGSLIDKKVFFYSVNAGVNWNQVCDLDPVTIPYLKNLRGLFIGDPSHAYAFTRNEDDLPPKEEIAAPVVKPKEETDPEADPAEAPSNPEGENQMELTMKKEAVKKRLIFEEMRLSFFLQKIFDDTSVVPRGAFMVDFYSREENVIPNPTFSGLTLHESHKLSNYLHLKKPVNLPKKTLLETSHLNKSLDFADPLNEDNPKDCWSLHYDQILNAVIGRSLIWLGFYFYHVPSTNQFGFFYFGDGEKNLDFMFMM